METQKNEKQRRLALLILLPSLVNYEKTKRRSNKILTISVMLDLAIMAGLLLVKHTASFICILFWVAVNVYSWLDLFFHRKQD